MSAMRNVMVLGQVVLASLQGNVAYKRGGRGWIAVPLSYASQPQL